MMIMSLHICSFSRERFIKVALLKAGKIKNLITGTPKGWQLKVWENFTEQEAFELTLNDHVRFIHRGLREQGSRKGKQNKKISKGRKGHRPQLQLPKQFPHFFENFLVYLANSRFIIQADPSNNDVQYIAALSLC